MMKTCPIVTNPTVIGYLQQIEPYFSFSYLKLIIQQTFVLINICLKNLNWKVRITFVKEKKVC
ncbi:hypothetical protein AKG34_24210 [Peribacillus butanolivorans]|nr:hypothetical protein AKG34_24210 [Peribacillus butanolivorans]